MVQEILRASERLLNESTDFLSLVELLRYRQITQPRNIAFTFLCDGESQSISFTYQELDQRSRAIASVLQGMKAVGERVLLLYQPGLEFIEAFLGCLYAGVVAVPLYPPRRNHHSQRLKAVVADAQAKFVLATSIVLDGISQEMKEESGIAKLTCVVTDKIDQNSANDWLMPNLNRDSLSFLQYTSGSTGVPKGVMISHGNLLYNSQLIHQCFGHTSESKGVIWLPPYHDMGLIGGILQPLYGGFPVTLMSPASFIKKPFRWLQAISHYRATTSGGPDFAYELCVQKITAEQRATLDLSSWDVAFTGAEPIRFQTLERFAEAFADCGFRPKAFYPCYGMAESTLIVSGGVKADPPVVCLLNGSALEKNQVMPSSGNSHQAGDRSLVGCGRTWLDHSIAIVDPESFTLCSNEKVGEIYVSGSSIASGYWNKPGETQQAFQNHLAHDPGRSYLRTGDLGFLRNGELFVTGRLKDLIIIAGRNHYPQDIEHTVSLCHPALSPNNGVAFSVEIADQENLVIAQEVDRNYLRKLNAKEVINTVIRMVSEKHEIQVHTVLLLKTGSLPKTSSGKVQRGDCRTRFWAESLDVVSKWSLEYHLNISSNTCVKVSV